MVLHIVLFLIFLFGMFLTSYVVLPQKPKSGLYIPFWKMGNVIVRRIRPAGKENVISKMQVLYPADDIRKAGEIYDTEKMGLILLLIFIGNTMALCISVHTYFQADLRNQFFISRNPAGSGEKVVEFDIYSGKQVLKKDVSLTIGEQKWTEEETNRMFREMIPLIEKEMLGKNVSPDKVCYNLNLVDSLDTYPVHISWRIDNYDVMNGNGVIEKQNVKNSGSAVMITAVLDYFGREMEHEFPVCVYPEPVTKKELFQNQLELLLQDSEKQSEESPDMILPDRYQGSPLSYHMHKSDRSFCIFALFLITGVLIYAGKDKDLEKEVQKRELQMKKDYPEIVSKMMLLAGAGMTLRSAFEKIAADYENKHSDKRFAYEEMLFTVREMKSGIAEGEAYIRFGSRCRVREFLKFSALLSQNLKKGNAGLLLLLEAEEKEAFEDRKSLARRLGEEAGTKLLLPMGLMLIVVIVIIVVPAFMSFSI